MSSTLKSQTKIALFEGTEIRRTLHNEEWRFSLEDIVFILTESADPKQYINKMKNRDEELKKGWVQLVHTLNLQTKGGNQKMNCVNTQGAFRIIQSIPSPRAEPFKLRLAQVGYERIKEIENPELAMQRMIDTYEKKGYPKERIEIRSRGIPVRKELTNERDERGVEKMYSVLTNEIYQSYSGMTNAERKEFKGMKNGNLRDGMTPTELILTMLAEQATTDITRLRDAEGVSALTKASQDGGKVAFKARQELIEQTGHDPISNQHFLKEVKKQQKLENPKKKQK
ncbi:MAG: phage antirepressor protein [Candidatus Peribacteria bacterium]|jgi:hypothetical protein|nr:phage antirepressor protein [Candidatus Peribacteria bacterium]